MSDEERIAKLEADNARLREWLAQIGDTRRLESDFIKTTRVWVAQALDGWPSWETPEQFIARRPDVDASCKHLCALGAAARVPGHRLAP
jgi:hypothetical protein